MRCTSRQENNRRRGLLYAPGQSYHAFGGSAPAEAETASRVYENVGRPDAAPRLAWQSAGDSKGAVVRGDALDLDDAVVAAAAASR